MIDSRPSQPSQLHSGKLIRLKTLLSHARGFNAIVLQHNNPAYRDTLITWLASDHPGQLIIDLKEFPTFPDFEQQFEQIASNTSFVHIINLESLSEVQQQAFYRGVNYHREHIAAVAKDTTILFWLPEPMIRDLALKAPDFWAWREQVFDFSLPVEITKQRWATNYKNTTNLKKEAKLKRIQEITDYLKELPKDQPARISSADLQHALGNLYQEIGDLEQAKEQLHNALATFRCLDEKHAYAQVLRDITEIQVDQGNLTEALNTLEKKVLPWFQKLNDLTEQAITYGYIAYIFQTRGQFDEALNIRNNKELPVYEQIGDVRAKAITMGHIAAIYQAKGQFDEALNIRNNEELPVYEQIGDVRAKAVTMGKIADILQARGQLDEALNIRKSEELPVYEQLSDARELLIGRAKLALLLWEIEPEQNSQQRQDLMNMALEDAQRLQIPEAKWIKEIMQQMDLPLP